jgi:surface protein
MAQVKFKFDPTIYSSVVPTVSGGGTATTTDVTNADGTITRTISYTSNPTRLYFGNQSTESTALLEVYEYPYTSSMKNFSNLFDGCTNLTYVNEDSFKGVSGVTNVNYCFRNCSSLRSLNLINWNLSSATSRTSIFYGCSSLTTLNLSGLNMGSRTMASAVFTNCTSLQTVIMKNCTATNMNRIIQYIPARSSSTYGAFIHDAGVVPSTSYATYWKRMTSVNEVIKYKFAVGVDTLPATMTGYSNNYACIDNVNGDGTITRTLAPFDGVTVPTAINFKNCTGLLSIEALEIPGLKSFGSMFYGCTELTGLDLTKFSTFTGDTSEVTNLSSMFQNCSKLTELNLSVININNVTTLANMCYGCSSLTSINVSGWDTSSVKNISGMFRGCSSLTTLDLSHFNTELVTTLANMFYGCSGLTTLDLSHFNTELVTTLSNMFYGCSGLTTLDLSNFNTGLVTTLSNMFYGCSSLTSIDISGWNTSLVTAMNGMFRGCSSLTSIDISGWNTSLVTAMNGMFYGCSSLTTLDLSNFNTGSVTTIASMFYGCSSLTSIDISGWDLTTATTVTTPFNNCTSLDLIYMNNSKASSINTILTNIIAKTQDDVGNLIVIGVDDLGSIDNTTASTKYWNVFSVAPIKYKFNSDIDTIPTLPTNTSFSYFDENDNGVVSRTIFANNIPTSVNFIDQAGLIELEYLDISKINNMSSMFKNCTNLVKVNTDGWNVSNVTTMSSMFNNCTNLIDLDTSEWNVG